MPDIPQPVGLQIVQPREDGRSQGGGYPGAGGHPARKVAETYQETGRVQPPDDRITIIGIPIEQITPSTQAALAGLVAENATLRSQVRRLEGTSVITKKAAPILERDAFIGQLNKLLSVSPGANGIWILMLVHVQTYEDIRRSSGVLAANTALDDVAHRIRQLDFEKPAAANDDAPSVVAPPPLSSTSLMLMGYVGGLTLGVLFAAPAAVDPLALARDVHISLTKDGYEVAGLSMALAIRTAAAAAGVGESALLTIARVDHLSRSSR
ncbi:MAG: hypothetical protein EPO08_19990 [Rhodospirillaceae bacterium]|nr:MAG: hypothetical protein EPO08_19990 [Rhodospirillaceae bacterium]